MAGANGDLEIVEKFRLVYDNLYNSANSEAEMQVLTGKVQELVTAEAIQEVSRITGNVVKEAVCHMKTGKTDVSACFTTDALLHAPDIMFEQLSVIFRGWVTHGKITPCLLVCSFLPLLKSPL